MRILVLLVWLAAGCLAQAPKPCRSPPLLSGSLSVSNVKFYAFAKYTYDALGERIRFKEMGSYENKTFGVDALLLFREGIMYTIYHGNKTCKKERLKKEDFHPMEIPADAALLGQVILGSSSGPGQGLLVNTYSFFNIVVGIDDPQEFIPPTFCQSAKMDETGEAADFYTLFKNIKH